MDCKASKRSNGDLLWTSVPSSLLSLIFGCLTYGEVLYGCYAVCRTWKQTLASWSRLEILSRSDASTILLACHRNQVKSVRVEVLMLGEMVQFRNLESMSLIRSMHRFPAPKVTCFELLGEFPNLTDLDLSLVENYVTAKEHHKLQQIPSLRNLVLDRMPHHYMNLIANLVFLRGLVVRFSSCVKDESILVLGNLIRLETLTLCCSTANKISGKGLEKALQNLTSLKRLTIKGWTVPPSFGVLATHLKSLDSLELVNGVRCVYGDMLSALFQLTRLRSLTLDGIHVQGLHFLQDDKFFLEYLSLSLNGFTREVDLMSYLCLTLREVRLHGAFHIWSREICSVLGNLPVLRTLSLVESREARGSGQMCSLRDDGLAELARSESLRDLTLDFCVSVTDDGIAQFKKSRLVAFTAKHCLGLTESAIIAVQKHLIRNNLVVVNAI